VARVDHDDFLVVLPTTGADSAVDVADRIRRLAAEHLARVLGGDTPPTVSAGVASYPADGEDGPALLAAAISAMGRAKHDGGDCVRVGLSPEVH
jgi:diguanylate cyclase (GGDEF)-like protein